ncbi:MAG: hypothetical protein ACM3X6_11225 [Patescibacteria group bacterium]
MRGFGYWRQIRLGLALVVFVLTLALLIGGQGLARALRVSRPLAQEMKAIPGLRGYKLGAAAGGGRLMLDLARVPDLERAAERALAAVEGRQKEQITELAFGDRRQGLQEAYYELRFSLEECMATGRYTLLLRDLESLADRHGLSRARVYPGRRFIYVQLEKGRAYLYEALPRPERMQPYPDQGGGAGDVA